MKSLYARADEQYRLMMKRANFAQLKNRHFLVFGILMLVSWLLYRYLVFSYYDYPGRFVATYLLGTLSGVIIVKLCEVKE